MLQLSRDIEQAQLISIHLLITQLNEAESFLFNLKVAYQFLSMLANTILPLRISSNKPNVKELNLNSLLNWYQDLFPWKNKALRPGLLEQLYASLLTHLYSKQIYLLHFRVTFALFWYYLKMKPYEEQKTILLLKANLPNL